MYIMFSNLCKYMNDVKCNYSSQYTNCSNHQYFLPINTQKGLRRRDNNPLDVTYLEFD